MTRDMVPWDGSGADSDAENRAFLRDMRRSDPNSPTHDPATCIWCQADERAVYPYSIYGPGQAEEERMSLDAARWNPSLEEEEAIIERARAVSIDTPLPTFTSDGDGGLRMTFQHDQY